MIKTPENKRILVVDDDAETRDILCSILIERKFIVEKACNGKDALKKIRLNKPDVILLDYLMPVMDGMETCRKIKNDPETRAIPIILCSATHIKEGKNRKMRVDGYLEKPFTIEKLFRKIDTLLKT
jgi:CheY-like chemotaxis protein